MSPSYQHSYVQSNIDGALRQFATYSIFLNLTLALDTDLIPDICVYPRRTMRFGEVDIIRMTEMPLTVIEIVSPKQSPQDVLEKFPALFAAGVKSCWLVVPITMTVNVYTAMDQFQIFSAGELHDPVLDIRLPLEVIFA